MSPLSGVPRMTIWVPHSCMLPMVLVRSLRAGLGSDALVDI